MEKHEKKSPAQFLEYAGDVASYYGFRPLRDIDPALFRAHAGGRRGALSFADAVVFGAQCVAVRQNEPMLAYYATPSLSHPPAEISRREAGEFCLQVAGPSQGLGEILVLKAATAILSEWGVPAARIRVNAFGDRDSRERFSRELSNFIRRRFGSESEGLAEDERQKLLGNPFGVYTSASPVVRESLCDAPRPLHFLSERSRTHFKELLEYLDQTELPYEIDDTLGGDEREPRIAFHIDIAGPGETPGASENIVISSSGGRYDDFVARLAGKRENSTVHASIFFRKKSSGHLSFVPSARERPKMYFIQLGVRAKLRGLEVVDILRRRHIPIAQSFDTAHLGEQLAAAQKTGVSYILIMGQREALDGTVIVRRVRNSSQQIVALNTLARFLATLRV